MNPSLVGVRWEPLVPTLVSGFVGVGMAASAGYFSIADAFTKLLLHCDGAQGSTVFTDSSPSARTITPNGNVQIDTAQSKFGGASALFISPGSFLSAASSPDWDFGTADFTIDLNVRRNGDQAAFSGLISSAPSGGGGGWALQFGNGAGSGNLNGINFFNTTGGLLLSGPSISGIAQVHVALIRYGNILALYYEGVQVATADVTGISMDSPGGIVIGRALTDLDNYYINAWLDEIRLRNGIASWGANFSPRQAPY